MNYISLVERDKVLSQFIELICIDSLSKKEGKMASYIKSKLEALGLDVLEDGAGAAIDGETGNLICRVKGTGQGDSQIPAILFAAHMDTVVPGESKRFSIKGDIVSSDGTTILGGDDAAGITCILEVIRIIHDNDIPHGDIVLVFTAAEEIGLFGSKNLDFSLFKADYGFVMDHGGPVGCAAAIAPYQYIIEVDIKGRAAHAGIEPEKGISAIQAAADALAGMKLGRIDFETTANIGLIKGGTAVNIVCEHVNMKGDARSINRAKLEEQVGHMKERFEASAAKYGASVGFKTELMYSGYNISSDDPIARLFKKATDKAGFEMILDATGGGSDTNIFNSKGIPSLNVSVGMEDVHSCREWVDINNLVKTVRLLLGIIEAAAEGGEI